MDQLNYGAIPVEHDQFFDRGLRILRFHRTGTGGTSRRAHRAYDKMSAIRWDRPPNIIHAVWRDDSTNLLPWQCEILDEPTASAGGLRASRRVQRKLRNTNLEIPVTNPGSNFSYHHRDIGQKFSRIPIGLSKPLGSSSFWMTPTSPLLNKATLNGMTKPEESFLWPSRGPTAGYQRGFLFVVSDGSVNPRRLPLGIGPHPRAPLLGGNPSPA